MEKKYEDIDWDFLNNRYQYTHDIHKYPAKLVPEIVEKLLERYQTKDMQLLFEPYVGSGTTLVEANIKGLNCICTDLNPLARKISKVKTTHIDIQELTAEIKKLDYELIELELNIDDLDVKYPEVKNIKYWFKERNIKELVPIKEWIDKIQNRDIKNIFEIAFSETLREVSLTRNNEFKRYRIPLEQIASYRKEAFFLMLGNLRKIKDKLKEYMQVSNKEFKVDIHNFNTVKNIPQDILDENSVDIVITSPPYGDSQSTVAYGQFSRFANDWLGHENSEKIDAMLMGGERKKEEIYFNFPLLDDSIAIIKRQDYKRSLEIMSFYSDYQNSINNISKVIKQGGIAAYVVGNRTIKGQFLETDEVTKHFFEKNGFQHLETIIRNISKKRLPSKVAPTGKKGKKVKTMHKEYIVVMKKL